MRSKQFLLSGRVPVTNVSNVPSDRYSFLHLSDAEPSLGTADANGWVLVYDTETPGRRLWSNKLISSYDHANAAFIRANNSLDANNGGTVTGDVRIQGNLVVSGVTTYVNTQTVLVADNILTLNAAINQSSAPVSDAGIEVDRGSSPNVFVLWNETIDKWTLTNDGSGYYGIASDAAESYANSAFIKANASFTHANSGFIQANSAYIHANAAYQSQNATGQYANAAFANANGAFTKANAAFANANGAFAMANAAYNTGNAAFIRANNSLNANVGGQVTGDVVVVGNLTSNTLTTTGSNGSITGANAIFTNYIFAANGTVDLYIYSSLAYAQSNAALATANASFANANGAFAKANGAFANANGAFAAANAAYTHSNSGFIHANSGFIHANSGFIQANAAFIHANSAYESQNATGQYANSAFVHANASFDHANAAFANANGAFAAANAAYIHANSGFIHANSGFIHANSAYESQNATGQYANAAFIRANNSLDANNGGTVTGNVIIAANLTTQNVFVSSYIDLNTSPSNPIRVEGRVFYDNDQKALAYYNESDMTFQIGQESVIRVWNNTGSTITDGKAVRINGSSSANGFPAIILASADTADNAEVIGITTTTIPNGGYGYVTTHGKVNGLNTSLFNEGDEIYLSDTPGEYQTTPPASPSVPVAIGYISLVDVTNGSILVRIHLMEGKNKTNGAILFARNGAIDQDPTTLFWDYANNRLGIDTATPQANLHVAGDGLFSGNVTITGNLVISNAQTITTDQLFVGGNDIVLNANTTGTPVLNAAIIVNRGTSPNSYILWDESVNEWLAYEGEGEPGHILISTKTANTWEVYSSFEPYEKETYPIGANLANATNEHAKAGFETANIAEQLAIAGFKHANSGFIQANSGFNHANSAYESQNATGQYANAAFDTGNSAFIQANSAFIHANAAYDYANTLAAGAATDNIAREFANSAGSYANSAFIHANSAFTYQNATASYANSAFIKANSAYESQNATGQYANAAFGIANTALIDAASAGSYANSGFIKANSAYESQNATGNTANSGFFQANAAFDHANAAFAAANNVFPQIQPAFNTANAAFIHANSGFIQANAAFDKANNADANALSAGVYSNSAYVHANASFLQANDAITHAQSAFHHANSGFIQANSAFIQTNAAFDHVNSAFNHANSGFIQANSAFIHANSAYESQNATGQYANAAFVRANNSLNANTGGQVTGDVTITGNLVVVGETVYANTQTVLIGDNIITLNAAIDQSSAPTMNAGIEVDRGSSSNVYILWNESQQAWQFTNDGVTYENFGGGSAGVYANGAFVQANAAFNTGNSAFIQANASYDHANAAFEKANSAAVDTWVRNQANSSFYHANGAYDHANAAFELANTAAIDNWVRNQANGAYNHANAAYAKANTTANGTILSLVTTGDGTNSTFALGFTPIASNAAITVSIGGIIQTEDIDYSITPSNSTISFTSPPPAGEVIRAASFTGITPYFLDVANSAGAVIETFNGLGDGSNTTFDIGFNPFNSNSIFVFIGGVAQPYTAYSVNTTSNTVTFTTAPGVNERIKITGYAKVNPYYREIIYPDVMVSSYETVATGNTAIFNLGFGAGDKEALLVSIDGVVQAPSTYTLTPGTDILTFNSVPANGEYISVVTAGAVNSFVIPDESVTFAKLQPSVSATVNAAATTGKAIAMSIVFGG